MTEALPDYRIRISARARRAQLRVTQFGEVEVVLPRGHSTHGVDEWVFEHRHWLWRKLAAHPRRHEQRQLPQDIALAAIDERWSVAYEKHGRAGFTQGDGELLIRGADEAAWRQALPRWLQQQAKAHLVPWCRAVSEELALPCANITIRGQRSRWGSCSVRGNLNLNRALLFLPADLVRYLFIHELCHTREMNHSAAFWRLVQSFEPDYRRCETALSEATRRVPLWALAGLR